MGVEPLEVSINFFKYNFVVLILVALVLRISYFQQLKVYLDKVKRFWLLVLIKSNCVVSDRGLAKIRVDLVPQNIEELWRDGGLVLKFLLARVWNEPYKDHQCTIELSLSAHDSKNLAHVSLQFSLPLRELLTRLPRDLAGKNWQYLLSL